MRSCRTLLMIGNRHFPCHQSWITTVPSTLDNSRGCTRQDNFRRMPIVATILLRVSTRDNFRRMPAMAAVLRVTAHRIMTCRIIRVVINSTWVSNKDTIVWIRLGLHRRDRCTESTRCSPDKQLRDKPFGITLEGGFVGTRPRSRGGVWRNPLLPWVIRPPGIMGIILFSFLRSGTHFVAGWLKATEPWRIPALG